MKFRRINLITSINPNPKLISDSISQVYVIHQTGLVLLSRKYNNSCVSNDPQLIGGFLAALLTFARTSGSEVSKSCQWEEDGMHKLVDIGMSCSRWFIGTEEEYTIALLVPYSSQLILDRKFDVIKKISDRIISTFLIFRMFDINVEEDIRYVKDYSFEFGNAVDTMIIEQLSEVNGSELSVESINHI